MVRATMGLLLKRQALMLLVLLSLLPWIATSTEKDLRLSFGGLPYEDVLAPSVEYVLRQGVVVHTVDHKPKVPDSEYEDIKALPENGEAVRYRRKVRIGTRHLWPNATVPYIFHDSIRNDTFKLRTIKEAMAHWHVFTCIIFVERTQSEVDDMKYYLKFVDKQKGCLSDVGMITEKGGGGQELNVGDDCYKKGTLIHELGHVIGFFHEHMRSDRNKNIRINWRNIRTTVQKNFYRIPTSNLAPYDIGSIMHYDAWAFTRTGGMTIEPLDPLYAFLMGQRLGLSFYDAMAANTLYNCADRCEHPLTCENEGILLKDCRCFCPVGLRGTTCREVATQEGCGGVVVVNDTAVLTSPGFPNHYQNGSRCAWLLKSPPQTTITLNFTDFDIETHRFGLRRGRCKDILKIRYGRIGIVSGPSYCGTGFASQIVSASNYLLLQLYSDSTGSRQGFRAIVTVRPTDGCETSPCANGGRCSESEGSFTCHCHTGWIGDRCHVENRLFKCDFGQDKSKNMCGIKFDQSGDFNWTLHRGPTRTSRTGPRAGHTYGNRSDVYIYAEASKKHNRDRAIFWLPYLEFNGLVCLEFYYHMHGPDIGRLQVRHDHDHDGGSTAVWSRVRQVGKEWRRGRATVLTNTHSKVGFRAETSDGFRGDIAIDDIIMSPGKC